MSHMYLSLKEGEECDVDTAVAAMTNLNSLSLCWDPKLWSVNEMEYCFPTGRSETLCQPRYHQVRAGCILRMLQQALHLTLLEILSVRIKVTEVIAILERIVSFLRRFGVSFADQHESSVDRFTTIVETIIGHNRELRTVSLRSECHDSRDIERTYSWFRVDAFDERILTATQVVQLKERRRMLRVLLSLVRRFVPFLDSVSLEKSWIDSVMWVDGRVVTR